MANPWYKAGTVSVTNNSKTVSGSNTLFIVNGVANGDIFFAPNGQAYEIDTVQNDTVITLTENYTGTTESFVSYGIVRFMSQSPISLANLIVDKTVKWEALIDQHALYLSGDASATVTAPENLCVNYSLGEVKTDVLEADCPTGFTYVASGASLDAGWFLFNDTVGNYRVAMHPETLKAEVQAIRDAANSEVQAIRDAANSEVTTTKTEVIALKDEANNAKEIVLSQVDGINRLDDATFAQHGLIPTDGVNEIRPQDMFEEVDAADVLVDKKGYPVRFSDGVYAQLGEELVTNTTLNNSGRLLSNTYTNGSDNFQLIDDSSSVDGYVSIRLNLVSGKYYMVSIAADVVSVSSSSINYINFIQSFDGHNIAYLNNAGTTELQNVVFKADSDTRLVVYANNVTVNYSKLSVRELPQYALPKAPFSTGSTDELLDDAVNGLTCQMPHSKSDIVVTGNELVTNGGFDTDVSGWSSIGDGTISWNDSGYLDLVTTSSGRAKVSQTLTLLANKTYTVVFESINSEYLVLRIGSSQGGNDLLDSGGLTTSGLHLYTFTPSNNKAYIEFWGPADEVTSTIDNISVRLADESYIALQDTAVGDSLADTAKFKPIPYVTKQAALLIEKDADNNINNLALPLVNMYGETDVETYEADIFGELGYSQKADRVWTNGTSEFILVGLKGYLNAGAYHPWFNEFGVNRWKSSTTNGGVYWYKQNYVNTSDFSLLSSFDFGAFGTDTAVPPVEVYGSVQGNVGYEARPDSKFYDKAYINGQGGLICFSIPNAKTPSYKHMDEVKRNLVDGYIENGVEVKYLQSKYGIASNSHPYGVASYSLGQWNDIVAQTGGLYPSTNLLSVLGNERFVAICKRVGEPERVVVAGAIPSYSDYITYRGIRPINSTTYYKTQVDIEYIHFIGMISVKNESNGGSENNSIVKFIKSPYLATQGTTTHTDLIGDPANYPADLKSLLASGKGVGFMNPLLVGQDGSDYANGNITPIHSKKVNGDILDWVYDEVPVFDGWKLGTTAMNQSINSRGISFAAEGYISIVSYQAQNQAAIPVTTPKPIQHVDRDLIASNHHSVYGYNGLTYAATGKVATGSKVESCGVDDVIQAKGQPLKTKSTLLINGDYYFIDSSLFTNENFSGVYKWVAPTTTNTPNTSWHFYNDYLNCPSCSWELASLATTPSHKTISLDSDSIVGAKALVTQTDNATQVFTQEMVWDYSGDDIYIYIAGSGVYTFTGVPIRFTGFPNSVIDNKVFVSTGGSINWNSASIDNYHIDADGRLVRNSDMVNIFGLKLWNGNGFGDSDQFDQLTSGTDIDLNGNTIQTKVLLKPSSCKLGDK